MTTILLLLVGLVLGRIFLAYAQSQGGAERYVLAWGLVVVAGIYIGFALIEFRLLWALIELLGMVIYGMLAWLGFYRSVRWLVAGWAFHPLWDVGLHLVGTGNTFTPAWYVLPCISFDLFVAGSIAFRFGAAASR